MSGLGALLARGRLKHQYPHSWRSKKPVIFRNTPQWFLAMDRPFANARDGLTLREIALDAIGETRWVPATGENRIRGMVTSKPDWVLSRQRAWGVPLAIFVRKGGNEVLYDEEVNSRIAAAFEREGADAWFAPGAKERFLGEKHNSEDYEKVDNLVEVWFDSGSTHAFVLEDPVQFPGLAEIRRVVDGGSDAVMYLEGSDQHRGWFQSSLLESCGTRGRAPFDIVLTHGFTLDEQGRKMSKSLGNQTFPQDVIRASGADILRLWAASVDYSDDQRIGPEILKAVSDNYRKLRNTIRWMLGTLAHHRKDDREEFAAMADLDRLMLHKLTELDGKVREAYANFDFARVVATLTAFMNADLSAFYFDVRKDALYCEPPSSGKRLGALQAIEQIFRCVTVWLAPILAFTAEEAWASRDPGARSVHLEQFPVVPTEWRDDALAKRWETIWAIRLVVTGALEIARANKEIGSSLEAAPKVYVSRPEHIEALQDIDFAEICITSDILVETDRGPPQYRFSSDGNARRRRDRRAGERCQVRALMALFRSVDGVGRLSGRHPARRGCAARTQGSRTFSVRPALVGCAVAVGVFMADQASKLALLTAFLEPARNSAPLTPFLDLALRWNRGVSFSLFVQNSTAGRAILLLFTIAAVALLIWWLAQCRSNLAAAGLGAIIGGALGNALDRVIHGAVVDFLDLHILDNHLFVFNLADAAINVGVALLVIDLFLPRGGERRTQPVSENGRE